MGYQNDEREGFLSNDCVKADSVYHDRELEEFEILERFTEKHTYLRNNNEFEINQLGKLLSGTSGTMVSVRKSASLPAMDEDNLLRNVPKFTDGEGSK